MKKSVLFTIFIILLFSISFINAQENATNDTITGDTTAIDDAYDCLTGKVSGKCSTLSVEEKIFSLLAIGECKDELLTDSLSAGECWPKSPSCKLKTTAQAILAYDKTTIDTTPAEEWLISQNTSPPDVSWYLQIDSSYETICSIEHIGGTYTVQLNEDKTITRKSGSAGCLSISNDFWLKVEPGCFGEEFEISCDKDFQTSLLFKRQTSDIWHVSGKVNPASANGKTIEKIKSSCFMEDGECDYEGSLWAAFVLHHQGYDISDYMAYLVTLAEENPRYLPESFLYALTGEDEYKTNLRLRQKAGKYWEETGDKFYDSAVALYSITDEPPEKTNTKNWLLDPNVQGTDGCFPTNVRNMGFLLASIWPRQVNPTLSDCINAGHYCVSSIQCETGHTLSGYTCPGVAVCCDTQPTIESCADQSGEICSSDENCVGGTTTQASDVTGIGEVCCVGGTCEIPAPISECEDYGGRCTVECSSGETEEIYECPFFGDVCCIPGEEKAASLWWIWLLIILIILVIAGIIFRKKLRTLFRKAPPSVSPRPGMPPAMARRPIQRRILPPSQRKAPTPKPAQKPSELSDVLKKLKELGK